MLYENNCEKYLVLIGQKIAARRHELGLKMETVEAAIGLSKTVISQIENGRYKSLKIATIIMLCNYLQITEMELLYATY